MYALRKLSAIVQADSALFMEIAMKTQVSPAVMHLFNQQQGIERHKRECYFSALSWFPRIECLLFPFLSGRRCCSLAAIR
jgi:hypothetical protein